MSVATREPEPLPAPAAPLLSPRRQRFSFRAAFDLLRLLLAVLSLAMACTAFIPAPTLWLWQLSIGATEMGHWFALVPILVLCSANWRRPWSRVASWVALVALAGLLSTLAMGAIAASTLPHRLALSWNVPRDPRPVLDWKRLFVGDFQTILPEPEKFTYPTAGGQPLELLYYRPKRLATRGPAPCVVVLHTGGWESGTPAEFPWLSAYLAARGYAVASLEYRLAPRWPWPAQREDTLAAMAWLKSNAAKLGLDPAKFVLLGRSAGGQIAQTVAYTVRDPAVRGCIAFYAPSDLDFGYRNTVEEDLLRSRQLLRHYLGGTPDEVPEQYRSASALNFVTPHTVPTLLFHGRPDPLVWYRHTERLDAVLTKAGVRHATVMLPWATHAFDWHAAGPGGQISTYAVERFLELVTK